MDMLEPLVKAGKVRVFLTHLNHSNPALDPAGAARKAIEARGFKVLGDGGGAWTVSLREPIAVGRRPASGKVSYDARHLRVKSRRRGRNEPGLYQLSSWPAGRGVS